MTDTIVASLRRDLVWARGPEAATYLHGQISQDVDDLAVGVSRWSFVLQPQGKVDGFFRITRTGDDEFVLDTDVGQGEALSASLGRFKLMTKVDFEATETAWVAVRGRAEAPDGGLVRSADVLGDAPGTDVLGDDVVVPTDAVGPEEWERFRIGAGVPVMGVDIDADTIPNETDLIESSVSFAKGCYRGQELVERIHSRGGQRFLLRRLRLAAVAEAGADIEGDGRQVGRLTSVVGTPDGASGLGYVRGDVEAGTKLLVGSVEATFRPLRSDEF